MRAFGSPPIVGRRSLAELASGRRVSSVATDGGFGSASWFAPADETSMTKPKSPIS